MKIGYIGLGKMGNNMVGRLMDKGHEVVSFDVNGEGTVASIKDLVLSLKPPRVVWLMVPHTAVEEVLGEVSELLDDGDTLIDGGNSPYRESMRRANALESVGVNFVDVGVSGGPEGARDGACIMVGGDKEDFDNLEPLFRDLAVPDGYGYMGTHGAGHFVKMVHNGIEYGMMQAIAEGFSLMKKSEFNFDLKQIADLYNHGSVVESRLIGWLKGAFLEFGQDMKGVSGAVGASGEGAWTVEAARDLGIPLTVIQDALKFRAKSKDNPIYTGKLLSAMRNQFGGHEVREK